MHSVNVDNTAPVGSTMSKIYKFCPKILRHFNRVSVQGVKSLGNHFACLCRGFEFYEVEKKICYHFSKRKRKYFYTLYHFYSEKCSKRLK